MRASDSLRKVVRALLDASGPLTGYEIMRQTAVSNSTVYQMLPRLEEAGWLTSKEVAPKEKGRPAGRSYELTTVGRAEALQMQADSEGPPIESGKRWGQLERWIGNP